MSRSSSASSTCRIDWRPSRGLSFALAGLALSASLALAMSALPLAVAIAGSIAACVHAGWLLRREARRPGVAVAFDARGAWWLEAGAAPRRLSALQVDRRGPLTTLSAQSAAGRVRLAWWPDTLSPDARRRLVLCAAALSRRPDKPLPAMAA